MHIKAKAPIWRVVDGVCITALAVAFVIAGMGKIISPESFVRVVRGHGLVPDALSAPVALYLAWLELCVGLGVLLPRWRSVSVSVASVLLAVFTAALVRQWWLGDSGDCGCMGMMSLSVPWAVGRNVVLLIVAGWLLAPDGRGTANPDTARQSPL